MEASASRAVRSIKQLLTQLSPASGRNPMPRKQRIDSNAAAVKIMLKAAIELFPPEHVPVGEKDLPFWLNITAEKAKAEWTAHDLELAALLARAMSRLEREETMLDGEDTVMSSAGGSPMQNPRIRAITDLHSRVIKYRQTLGIHDRGKNGEKRDSTKRREMAKEIETDLGDELIKRPSIQ